jgi:outer membrane protein assembly factor BamB
MNGTPAYQDRKVYLPGVYRLPMACLSAEDGSIVWEHDHRVDGRYRWFVDAPSLGPDYFTVNNKYQGGALRWNLADGRPVGWPDATVQLWGPGHGCGSVVLTSEGAALSATINGLSAIDSKTGRLLWKSPGFASYACPPPIVSNGRIFYCPQVSGTLYCFEPTGGD